MINCDKQGCNITIEKNAHYKNLCGKHWSEFDKLVDKIKPSVNVIEMLEFFVKGYFDKKSLTNNIY